MMQRLFRWSPPSLSPGSARSCDEFECYGYRRVGAALRHQGGPCHANDGVPSFEGKMADEDLVRPPPIPAYDHPARRLALPPLHAQLSRRRRSTRGARSGCLLRDGAAMGLEVRAVVCPRTSPSTPTANGPVASRRECAAKAPTAMEVRSCIRDEGRPLEADRQG
jgi:hypothetical protein